MIVLAGLVGGLVPGVAQAQPAPATSSAWDELPVGTEFVLTDDDGGRLLGYGRVEATHLGLQVSDDREDEVVVMIVTPDGSVGTLEGRIRSGAVLVWIDGTPTHLEAWLRERGLSLRVERAPASDEDDRSREGDEDGGDPDDRERDDDERDDDDRDDDGAEDDAGPEPGDDERDEDDVDEDDVDEDDVDDDVDDDAVAEHDEGHASAGRTDDV